MIDPLITCPHCYGVFQPDPEQVDLAAVEVLAIQLYAPYTSSPHWQGLEPEERARWRKLAREMLAEAAEDRLEPADDA